LFGVEDNAASGAPDRFGWTDLPEAPTSCPVDPGLTLDPIDGDLVVHDAQAFPTSKDQCKNGGWRQFGFKNQGECAAFVQRPPKP
jgi:hypothetical protein